MSFRELRAAFRDVADKDSVVSLEHARTVRAARHRRARVSANTTLTMHVRPSNRFTVDLLLTCAVRVMDRMPTVGANCRKWLTHVVFAWKEKRR